MFTLQPQMNKITESPMSSRKYKNTLAPASTNPLTDFDALTWTYSKEQGTLLISPNIQRQLGFTPINSDSVDWKSIVHPDDLPGAQQKISTYLTTDSPIFSETLRLRAQSGDYHYYHLRSRQFKQTEKTTIDGLCIDLPCCDNKLSHIQETQEQSFKQSNLIALGKLASSIAHEINNPLSVIRMNAELLQFTNETSITKEKINDRCSKILNTVDHISGIVTALKAISSSTGKLNLKWINIGHLLDNITDLCRHKMRYASIDLNVNFETDRNENIYVDQAQLTQAILNLLSNSYDSINQLHKKWIDITIRKEDLQLIIDVTDSGTGIAEDIVNNMMTPFYTTKKNPTQKSEAGLGLGLSLVSSYISGHNGTVSYNLLKGHTNFRISIPLHFIQPPTHAC